MDNKEATERLEQAFHNWISSDDFRKLERLMRVFHHYSFHNLILILFQKPDATRVAGFNAWKKLNRVVKKGEKGIMIFAPCTYRYKTNDDGEEKTVLGIKGFKPVYVFDVSQTEGEPLEDVPEPHIEDEYDGLQIISDAIEKMAYTIDWYGESLTGEKGYVRKGTKIIHVLNTESSGQKASTLLHEWAHLQIENMERDTEEIVVQTASYFIMARLGLDTSWYTAQYVQSWAQSKDWKEISKLFSVSDKLSKKFFEESGVLNVLA